MTYKVKDVAETAGVSVRTLHHYDQIGLLKPTSTTDSGYRLYTDQDLERLQQIMFLKELDFSLQEVREILDTPGFDRMQALASQKKLLLEKRKRLDAIIDLVDKTLYTIEGGDLMAKKEMFEAFDMTEIERHQQQYAEETRQKYVRSSAYQESQKKTAGYSQDDWAVIQTKANKIYQNLADLMDYEPSEPQVQEAIGQWRQHITDHFYTCTLEIFRGLGDLYVQDERFTANIDGIKPGLAAFMCEAMHIYCDRNAE
ncbi:MerR family transcriptional regulator [Heliobacterium chlorum]|uniref:MerR family transcriptional regulator n=1 Tax=Heliobacterium chlorum TaxID=2698 RepID=A0ABR7T0C9_HELCL|nr:MerR family transcriptional regulator [Heliobacterium chlorum]MBC9784250.1 MerR family transcriptional regulator [Heliobacterium chlorum]